MLPTSDPDRIDIADFDDDRLKTMRSRALPATRSSASRTAHLDLGDAPGRANAGDKLLTLVASALAGGDCIADADAMRAGGAGRVLGCTVKAPSTLGTFLRSFRWGHVRQLDRVSRALLARAWAAGAGPGAAPFRSTSTRRSVRPTAWRRRAPATTATRACAAITRCSPLRPGRVTC